MSGLSYRGRVDLGVAIVVFAVGAFFLWQASLIDSFATDGIGPGIFPTFLAIAITALSVLVGINAFRLHRRGMDDETGELTPEAAADDAFGFQDSDLVRVFVVIALGFVYVGLFHALGYLLATLLSLAFMLFAFGNRRWGTIIGLAVVGALAYDYVFMNLMGLYDPPGAFIDLKKILGLD